ncbi:MAG: glutathione S-transferase family protein [Solirubrobacterales bacterium]
MKITLYGIPSSHPVRAAQLMLEYKGVPFRRVNMLPVLSRQVVPHVLRFPSNRVPAIKIDGRKVQGTREIAVELERLTPEPPLFPGDPAVRDKVDQAEHWGDEFQQFPRTIIWWAMSKAPASDQESYLKDAKLGLPPSVLARTGGPIIWGARRANDSYDPQVRALLEKLPEQLDKIDAWIGEGVLNGEQLNVADFQIGTSLRLLMSMQDLRPAIEARPAGALATRVQPEPPGDLRSVFPPEWLEPLRAGATATV